MRIKGNEWIETGRVCVLGGADLALTDTVP